LLKIKNLKKRLVLKKIYFCASIDEGTLLVKEKKNGKEK
jgi:hypothetical protein